MSSPLLDEVAPPLPSTSIEHKRPWTRIKDSITRLISSFSYTSHPEPPPPPSGYLTLIPLSDARLQPRDTRITAFFLLIFALLIASCVFITVPRGISIGEINVIADRMSWNTSKASYQLRLLTSVSMYNPNYLPVSIEGDLKVLFYKAEAGRADVVPLRVPARVSPFVVDVVIDASDVPADYILSILSQCSTFPEVLIFFLKGRLQARYLWQTQHLPPIDTYFMINCKDGGPDHRHDSDVVLLVEKITNDNNDNKEQQYNHRHR